jgi:hypothetical protein
MMECRRFEGEDKWEDSGKKRESRDKEVKDKEISPTQ